MSQRSEQTKAAAEQYRVYVARGDVVMAEQTRRTIDDLGCGHYRQGRWTIDTWVLRAMGEFRPSAAARTAAADVVRLERMTPMSAAQVQAAEDRVVAALCEYGHYQEAGSDAADLIDSARREVQS